MKVIIAGSRSLGTKQNWEEMDMMDRIVDESGYNPMVVVSGRAVGVDRLGEAWAIRHGRRLKFFVAEWGRFGVRAGPIRNAQMVKYSDAAIIIWDGISKGTADLIQKCEIYNLKHFVKVIRIDGAVPDKNVLRLMRLTKGRVRNPEKHYLQGVFDFYGKDRGGI